MDITGLPIQFEAKRECGRLTLAPEINNSPWDVVEKCGTQVITGIEQGSITSLIVDLSPLNYLGSAQVALLVRVWKALSGRQGKMVVQLGSPVVRDVLRTAGLNRLWQFVDTRAEAYELLGVNPEGMQVVHWGWLIGAGIAGVAGLIFTALDQFQTATLGVMGVLLAISCGALSVACGLHAVVRGGGVQRILGILFVVAGVGVGSAGIYSLAHRPESEAAGFNRDGGDAQSSEAESKTGAGDAGNPASQAEKAAEQQATSRPAIPSELQTPGERAANEAADKSETPIPQSPDGGTPKKTMPAEAAPPGEASIEVTAPDLNRDETPSSPGETSPPAETDPPQTIEPSQPELPESKPGESKPAGPEGTEPKSAEPTTAEPASQPEVAPADTRPSEPELPTED